MADNQVMRIGLEPGAYSIVKNKKPRNVSNTRSPNVFGWLRTRLISTTILGTLVMGIVSIMAPAVAQVALLGCYLSILGGLVWEIIEQENVRQRQMDTCFLLLKSSRKMASDSSVLRYYEKIVAGISASLEIDCDLFRQLAIEQIQNLGDTSGALGRGVIEFHETETWRIAYEKVLRDPRVSLYQSVALIDSENYWQDEPGKRSIQLNFDLQDEKGLNIERTAIIAAELWPQDLHYPTATVFKWLKNQYANGIWTELVRRSALGDEPQLVADIGIYGDLAVGKQILDTEARTTRFELSFNQQDIHAAKQVWERLKLFTVSIRKLLDQEA